MISFSRNITRIRCFREIKAIKIYSHSFASLPEKSDKELLKEADTIEHFLEVGSGYNISTISKEKENAHSFDDPSYPLHSSWLHLETQHPLLQKYQFDVNEFARGARMAAKTFFSSLLRITKWEYVAKEDKELLHTITTSAGYELLKLPTDGNDLEMSKNVDLKIKINAISIPLYKSIHLKIVDGTSSNISNKKVSDKNATQTDAISEMVNDLKLEHDLASTSQFVRTSKVGDKTYKMNIVLRYIIAFCRTVYLLHKRTDVQFIESFIDYSQYAPGSVVISFPVDVTFTGSGKIIELKLKKENSTDEVINESVSKSTESATPAITTSAATTTTTATTTATGDVTTEKILTANITEWTSKPEKALLYFTGCISGHTELEWKISYVRIMSNSD